MNNKGQAIFLGIMIAITIFIVVVIMITPTKEFIITARDTDHLNCTANPATLSTGVRGTCILIDWWLPYFVGVSLAAAGALITGRKLIGGGK